MVYRAMAVGAAKYMGLRNKEMVEKDTLPALSPLSLEGGAFDEDEEGVVVVKELQSDI
jgi:hypothetical protein